MSDEDLCLPMTFFLDFVTSLSSFSESFEKFKLNAAFLLASGGGAGEGEAHGSLSASPSLSKSKSLPSSSSLLESGTEFLGFVSSDFS